MKNNRISIKVKDGDKGEWKKVEFDLDKCGVSYRTQQPIMIVPHPHTEHFGAVFNVHPDARADLLTRLLQIEVIQD